MTNDSRHLVVVVVLLHIRDLLGVGDFWYTLLSESTPREYVIDAAEYMNL